MLCRIALLSVKSLIAEAVLQQLVGLKCINCQRTVDSIVEGRFCVGCQSPVHKDCIVPPDEANASGRCRVCGANLSEAAELAKIERLTRPEPPAGLPAITINGIGVSYCFARGAGDVGGDALQCFVVMFMPLAAMKAVHLLNETHGFGTRGYRSIPLKWSNNLVWRVYCLYWAGTNTAPATPPCGRMSWWPQCDLRCTCSSRRLSPPRCPCCWKKANTVVPCGQRGCRWRVRMLPRGIC